MRLTPAAIKKRKNSRGKIVALTAYDYAFARILDRQGVDIVLVGDSLGMVVLGHESTVNVSISDMIRHTAAVSRGVKKALVVADMPFGSYDTPRAAVRNAKRLLTEGKADAVKLEGGVAVKAQVKALRKANIAVMGHVGMTPQTAAGLGGYKVQGRDAVRADEIMMDASVLNQLGVFSMVLECVPSALAAKVTKWVKCPTIGIGAGSRTDGQVLVLYDMLGLQTAFRPRFVRYYAKLEKIIGQAVSRFAHDVRRGKYPSKSETYF